MAADTFEAIKEILNKGTLADDDAHRLLLAGIVDLNDKFDDKEKAQVAINEKVNKMWPVHRFNVWLYGLLGFSVVSLIWSLITGLATIEITP